MASNKDFDEDGNYIGPENRSCPVGNCASMIGISSNLSKRITWVGGTILTVLGLVITVVLFMTGNTLTLVKEGNAKLAEFIDTSNTQVMARQQRQAEKDLMQSNVTSTLVANVSAIQKQVEKTSNIQLDVVKEVAVLKNEVGRVKR